MTVAECTEGSDLLEKMFAVNDARVLADDPTKTVEERQAVQDTFPAMKAYLTHRQDCSICKRQSADDFCGVGEGLAGVYLAVARDVLRKSEAAPNESIARSRVDEALSALQRHQRHCDVCR